MDLKSPLNNPTVTGLLTFTGSRIDVVPTSGNAVLQLHSAGGRYTINVESGGEFQIFDNDNNKSVLRYAEATQSTTINSKLIVNGIQSGNHIDLKLQSAGIGIFY